MRVAVGPAVDTRRAEHCAGDDLAGVDRLAAVGDDAGFGQLGNAIPDCAGMDAEIDLVGEAFEDGVGQ